MKKQLITLLLLLTTIAIPSISLAGSAMDSLIDRVLFAFHEENWASGLNTGTTEIRKITLNPRIKTGTFRPE